MEFKLKAEKREKNEKLASELMPAVLYGKGVASESLKIRRVDFDKIFAGAGESNLIELDFGSGPVNVLIKDTQRDIMKYAFTHVDFYQVNMKEKITTAIPLHFVGEPKAVKELGGMLMKEIHELEVECLPTDLVDHIDIDVSILNTFDDVIKIGQITLPKGLALVHHSDDVVVFVAEPKIQEEEKPVEAEVKEAATSKEEPAKKE